MAAIDFPASPTDGQLFLAPNGVYYQWRATPGMWAAVSAQGGTTPGGDVSAYCANAAVTGSYTTIVFGTVITGNSGGWLNTTNGRFTPPAGRFRLHASVWGFLGSSQTQTQIIIRKNGVAIIPAQAPIQSTMGANYWGQTDFDCIVDANGTDWFDIQALSSAVLTNSYAVFDAFPLSGIQGPPGPPGPVGGDFWASGVQAFGTTFAAVTTPAITGNSGSWYNPANGRWTPPAGRYFVWGGINQGRTDQAVLLQVQLWKNGANISGGYTALQVPGAANWAGDPEVKATVDMNGTDYLQIMGYSSVSNANLQTFAWFGAFPISGVKGPQGDPGPPGTPGGSVWQLLGRKVVTGSPAAQIDFSGSEIPGTINSLWFECNGLVPSVNDVPLGLRFFDGSGAVDTGNNYYTIGSQTNSGGAVGGTPGGTTAAGISYFMFNYNAATYYCNSSASVGGISAEGRIPMRNNFTARRHMMFQSFYVNGANTMYMQVQGGGQWINATGVMTGLRFFFPGANINVGGVVSLWGSP